MIQIRENVFETNSSSTHSITMCSKEEYERWKNGMLLYDEWGGKLVPINDGCEYDEDEFKTYEQFYDNYYLEKFYAEHRTASGEIVVAFGEYGYDG